MDIKKAFAISLKNVRKAQGLTQEDFSDISSRTYVSTLERGLKSPTLEKLDSLAKNLNIHPITLMVVAYSHMDPNKDSEQILKEVKTQLESLNSKT